MVTPLPWSPWATLPGGWCPSTRDLQESLDGGQAFRWRWQPEGVWQGQWAHRVAQLRRDEAGVLAWRTLAGHEAETLPSLLHYLGDEDQHAEARDQLPWRSDPVLAECLRAFPRLHLLRQPPDETLLGFLCSATKQIPQIRQMMDALAVRLGTPIAPGLFRLPTWAELAEVSEEALRACGLGFRARHVHAIALRLRDEPPWLSQTWALPYAEAKARLLTLPGVGEKIADCVLLFGPGHREAFPVDTWILQALAQRYGLADWKPAQVAHFGRTHFGAQAGLAQQHLFATIRAQTLTKRSA